VSVLVRRAAVRKASKITRAAHTYTDDYDNSNDFSYENPGSSEEGRPWTDDERNKLTVLLKARRELERKDSKLENFSCLQLFVLVSKQLQLHSIDRAPGACRDYWNRKVQARCGVNVKLPVRQSSHELIKLPLQSNIVAKSPPALPSFSSQKPPRIVEEVVARYLEDKCFDDMPLPCEGFQRRVFPLRKTQTKARLNNLFLRCIGSANFSGPRSF